MGQKAAAVTEATFEQDVLSADQPVLVDVWAEWCGPCKMISPIVDEIAGEYAGKLRVVKVDADANPTLIQQYGIASIPTLLLFNKGEMVARLVGFKPKEELLKKITPHLS